MTPGSSLAHRLAEHFPSLDAAAMGRHPAFREATAAALGVADERAVVEAVVRQGGLAGARNPHAVIVSRLRQVPSLAERRRGAAVERAAERALDSPTARALRVATDRGALLRVQVGRGVMTRAEALDQLAGEFRNGADLLAIAVAAFERPGAPETSAHDFPSGRQDVEQRSLL